MAYTLEIESLSKNFGSLEAVKNLSFRTKKGEIIALLGPNGAGKSTLMNMIAGYLSPSFGTIKVLGKDIAKNPLWGKENIGFLAEGAPMYPDLSVSRFLTYMAELRGLENVQKAVSQAAETAKIVSVLSQKIETLSKGYLRRVGFAQSILSNPPILLLDEPTDGLDPNQKVHIRSLISEMGKSKTILISTHLLEEAEMLCNRILIINKGQILTDGSLPKLLKYAKSKDLATAFVNLTTSDEEV